METMINKFEQLPIEVDTQILLSSEMKFGEIECTFQAWIWSSIQGNSLIFRASDLGNRTDDDLKNWITSESEIVQSKSSMKIYRNTQNQAYIVVSFDFQVMD